MKKFYSVLLTSILIFTLAGCSSSKGSETSSKQPQETNKAAPSATALAENANADALPSAITVNHDMGTSEVPYSPEKIAVLDLAVLDILDALELGGRVIGIPKSSSVSYLADYVNNDSITDIGSLKEVDMEALHSLQPDVIFIGGRLTSEYEAISAIAPTVLVSVNHETGYMETFRQNVEKIASMFGEEKKAQELLSGFDSRIDALQDAAKGKTALLGLVTSGSINTLGNASRCSFITNEVGFENVGSEIDSTHGDSASFELFLKKNPDYIFALDRDTAIQSEGSKAAAEILENEIVMKTAAYQNGNIIYLTPDVWYLAEGGITATDTMLKDLEGNLLQ